VTYKYTFRFRVNPETSHVPALEPKKADEVSVIGGQDWVLAMLLKDGRSIGGIRLSSEDMDRLCKEWIDARRVCPFCHKSGMDVRIDEQPFMDAVETQWQCEHCDGETNTLFNPGSVPWEDPLEKTR